LDDTPLPSLSSLDFPSITLPRELGTIESSEISATLGPFMLSHLIGRGGMGVVFAGTHIEQNVPVAIKVITRKGVEYL
jgi:serine/threonine protein kinase